MPVNKIDPKVIFASNAPAIDNPPVFSDKTKGWDVARLNDGRPTIKEMNKIQQDTDLKILWLNENAVLPYDLSIDYPDGAVAIKDGSFKQLSSGSWVEFLDDFADKDEVKRGIANCYDSSLTYNSGERVVLDNGDIVKSTIDGNINNPNVNMTGWVNFEAEQQEINNKFKRLYANIEDFGADVSKTALENSNAINDALQNAMYVYFPHGKTYQIDYDLINVRSGQRLYGGATLQGQQTTTTGADGRGVFLKMRQVQDIYVEGITIKNGYRGRLIECNNSKDIHFKNVTADGGTYNLWCGETNIGTTESPIYAGSQNITMEDCRFMNARYWGCYVRGWGVTDDLLKTQNIKIIRPYIYNAGMAGLVLSEGHVYNVYIESPYFQRCNVCCHFEESTHTTMIDFRDKDTGKKPDHEPANTEYPFENYSLYTAFSSDTTIFGGKFSKYVYHFSTPDRPSRNYKYFGSEVYEVLYESAGSADTNKVTFQDYIFDGVTSERLLGWQNTGASHYLRGFVFNNCKVLNDNDSVSRLGLVLPRTVDLTVTNCLFKNSKFELYSEGVMKVTGNRVTNKNIAVVCEINGLDQASSIGEFTGNYFFNGNVNLGYYAFRVRNFKHFKYQGTTVANSNVAVAFGDIGTLVWGNSVTEGVKEKPYNLANVTTVIDESKPDLAPTVTTAAMTAASNSINTTGKYVGRTVYNSDTLAFYKAIGSAATALWRKIDDNTVTITPV